MKKQMFFRKFGTVLLAVSAATIITLLVPPLGGGGMYFLFLTAIVFSSLYGDFRAGIVATALSILICVFFVYYDDPKGLGEWLVLPAFAFAAGFTVLLCYAQVGAEAARRQAERRYRVIFEDAITGIYETTLDGHYAAANPKLAQMFGYESANEMMREAENLNRRFYVNPNRREEFVRLVEKKENLVAFESEIYRRDGAKIWISENALAVRDDAGKLVGFQGTTIEITDRKLAESELKKAHEELERKVVERTAELERANQILREEIEERERIENALRESQEKFRALVEMSGELIWEVDENTNYTYISPVSKESNGYEPEELIGKKPFFLMPEEEARRVAKIFKKIGEKQEKFVYLETINIHKDGSTLVSETSGVPFFDDAGNFRGYRGVARNITERRRADAALRASEKRYRELVENAKDFIYTADLDGNFTSLNRAGKEFIGATDEQVLSAAFADYFPPEHQSLMRQKLAEKLAGEERTVYEIEVIVGNRRLPLEVSSWLIYDEEGKAVGTQGIARDLTDRKRAETALRESEKRYRELVENARDYIYTVNFDGYYTSLNRAGKEFMDVTDEEVKNTKLSEIVAPEYHALMQEKISEKLAGKVTLYEVEIITKDQQRVPVELNSWVIYEDGKPAGIQGIARNVAERRQAENALRESEKRYRELVENAHDIIFTHDLHGNYTSLNRLGEQLFNCSHEEVKTLNISDTTAPGYEELVREMTEAKLKGQNLTVYEMEAISLSGLRFPIEISSWLIYDESGNPVGVQGIARDIAERKRAEETIQQSQEMLQLVMDTIPQGVFWKDPNGIFIGCNQYVAQRAGLERGEQIIGLSDYDLPWTKEESDFYRECDRRVMKTGIAELGIVETLRQADGKDIWLETNKVPLKNSVGETVGVLGTFKDITDQKRAEAALRESELRLGSVVTAAPVILFAVDSDGIFTLSEGKGLESLGLKASEVVGKSVFELYADVPKIVADIKRALAGESFINNVEIGDLIYESRYTPLFDEQGAVAGIIGVSFDITERKKIENALRESDEKFRSIVEVVSDCIWEANEKGEYKFVSPQFKDVIGYEPEELIGKTPYHLMRPSEVERVIDYLKPIAAARQNFVFVESVNIHKNGDLVITETSGVPVFDEAGNYCGYRGVVRDITERKRRENQLRASQKQLRDLSAHLQSVREEERRNLARELHDEFGQSMTALKIELVRLGGKKAGARGDNKIPAMIDIVDTAMGTIRKIVSELRPGVLDELGLAAAMEWQTKEFQKRTGIACGLNIEFEEPAACIKLKTTVFRIMQECLTNIARHAAAKNVRITLRDEGTRIFFEVEDDGRGIDLARVEASDSHSFGILGMRERALLLDGTVEISRIESDDESGTRVTVSIPRPSELIKFV